MALRRTVVLGLDGVPCRTLRRLAAEGDLPHLAALFGKGSLRAMRSVLPTVSNCAWASFMTGLDPGGHNVYGFIDRKPETWDLFIPTSRHRTGEAIWERLSRLGSRVCVINVPGTYPPKALNGVLVSCFMTPSVDKACADPAVVAELKQLGYRIDVDGWQGRRDKEALLADVHAVIDARERAFLHFLRKERWDFFMGHVMSVDRLQHFAWDVFDAGDPAWEPKVREVYRRVDRLVGAVADEAGEDCELVLLSDHGFCTVKREVQVNRFLEEQGWLVLKPPGAFASPLHRVDPYRTKAYSLIPGRIYLNLKGRESGGIVEPGAEAETLKRDIAARLLDLRDPDTGNRVLEAVLGRDEAFHGEAVHRAPDLIASPADGYDLKGTIACDSRWQRSPLTGMHSCGDAFLYVRGADAPAGSELSILDAHEVVLRRIGLV
jgi:predicted AlkP superfamily phosphohydrolase/phosphomutase